MKKLFWINPIIVTVIILFLTTDCKKEKFTSLPVLSTTSISSVADNNAESKSKVVSDGGEGITARGVCWNTSPNPSIDGSKTTDDKGVGTFISKITGLTAGTVYYLRAYATNAIGTAYSDEITFSTKATLPTLSTAPVTGVSTSSATSGGNINYDGGGTITARGVCWGTIANPTTSNLKTTDGTGTGVFTSKIDGLTAGTTYHLRAYATNSLGTAYGSDITFSTSAVLPVITTSPVSAITSSTAASGGTITTDGGASITARGICWSTTANPTTSDSKTSDGSGTGQFVSSLTGLTAGATYHLRAYAVNSAGTAYGADVLFVTLGQVPASVAQQATNLTITGVTLNGVVNPNNLSTIVTFEYGLTTSYGQTIAAVQSPITGNSITNVSADITGLTQGTTYHFRVKTVNALGTVYSGDMSFVTPNFATLNTIIISAITSNSATSGGNIITDGGAPVNARGVCWNTTGNPTVADNKSSDGSGTGSYVSLMSGLLPSTTYYVRSYATNSLGTSYGNQITFLTLATTPTLTTASLTGITSSTATSGGTITSDGGAQITARGVCWSTTPNPTTAGTKTINGSGTGSFASNLISLNPFTTYYVRAYATNSAGTAYGNELIFNTLATAPTVTTTAASSISQSTAISGGNVISDGGAAITARGVCWSTTANPSVSGNKTNEGPGAGSFMSSISGLLPNTLYYIRAYAVNSIGTSYGSQLSFTTMEAPVLPTNGLVAKWEFNNTIDDAIGSNHLSSTGLIRYEEGKLGESVKIENSAILSTGALKSYYSGNSPFTISFWYKSSLLVNWSNTVFSIGKMGSNGFDISYKQEYIGVRRFIWATYSPPTNFIATSYDPYPDYYNYTDGLWHHLVTTYDGSTMIFYVDGVKIGEVASSYQIGSDNTLYFGAERQGVWPCNGNFDNAYFYSRAITPSEVSLLWNNGNGI